MTYRPARLQTPKGRCNTFNICIGPKIGPMQILKRTDSTFLSLEMPISGV
ncbi:hypothetical protein GGE45_002402 [Rhizobium aethiopicum]|uniref:Uncharacterized protein n=1 Tax=Rhizobium aethiopicum TaxID=1138170 RepID=A0A7W6MEL3_9HYPH|nr:hypothetical protein [Rhizobium aethiopicum]MBB4580074.1 hypothetical protein [Rhizobium aethiopicum]